MSLNLDIFEEKLRCCADSTVDNVMTMIAALSNKVARLQKEVCALKTREPTDDVLRNLQENCTPATRKILRRRISRGIQCVKEQQQEKCQLLNCCSVEGSSVKLLQNKRLIPRERGTSVDKRIDCGNVESRRRRNMDELVKSDKERIKDPTKYAGVVGRNRPHEGSVTNSIPHHRSEINEAKPPTDKKPLIKDIIDENSTESKKDIGTNIGVSKKGSITTTITSNLKKLSLSAKVNMSNSKSNKKKLETSETSLATKKRKIDNPSDLKETTLLPKPPKKQSKHFQDVTINTSKNNNKNVKNKKNSNEDLEKAYNQNKSPKQKKEGILLKNKKINVNVEKGNLTKEKNKMTNKLRKSESSESKQNFILNDMFGVFFNCFSSKKKKK